MSVLVGCEQSGEVRDALMRLGIDAMSCDFKASAKPGPHYQGNLMDVIHMGWRALIVFPDCTYLTSAGLHWNKRGRLVDGRPRAELTAEALDFVRFLLDPKAHGIPRIRLENPIGCIGTQIRKADQTVQPYQFGDDASKATCFWTVNMPPLTIDPARRVAGRIVVDPRNGRQVERWANQTDGGQNRLPPSADRAQLRAVTYPGIAEAIALSTLEALRA